MNEFTKKSVSLDAATRMAATAVAKAKEIGFSIAVCIVDESGIMKYFARMDDAPLISIDAARKKAVTAVGLGLPTGKPWFDFIKDDPILREGAHAFQDFMLMGGGIPVVIGGRLAGAIGVSGGHYEQDQLCAQAAIQCL